MSPAEKDKLEAISKSLREGKIPKELTLKGWNPDYPLLDHQRAGVLWSVVTPRGLLADGTGLGKTGVALGLLSWLKTQKKLGPTNRAIIIVPAISVYGSWKKDGFEKFVPGMKVVVGRGTAKQREKIYEDCEWEVLLTNYEVVRNDIAKLTKLGFKYVILDEADAVRNHSTKTARSVKRLTRPAKRVLAMTATPIQNNLLDLHGILEACGLNSVFGNQREFRKEYEKTELKKVYYNGKWHFKHITVGYKNTAELKSKLQPYYFRRTYKDIDAKMPELHSQTKLVELSPEQRRLYREIQAGFARITPDSPRMEIKAALLRLRQVCTTTATLSDESDHSAKFDWLIKQLGSDWADEKVVIFSNWITSIDAFAKRLERAGVGYVTMTGSKKQEEREELRQRFWSDDKCRVLIGTTAIEKSLNLQCARIQINLDMLWNPSRHGQLAGRVQRLYSIHDEAFVFSLITAGTVEEGIMKLLESKQAIFDHIFDEESEIFDKLEPADLVKLIHS